MLLTRPKPRCFPPCSPSVPHAVLNMRGLPESVPLSISHMHQSPQYVPFAPHPLPPPTPFPTHTHRLEGPSLREVFQHLILDFGLQQQQLLQQRVARSKRGQVEAEVRGIRAVPEVAEQQQSGGQSKRKAR